MAATFYDRGDIATRLTKYQARISALRADRSTFEAHWRELGDFLLPRRTRFWTGDRNKGDKRNHNIIDSTGRFAARTLQSGLHAGLTSPARPWMKLTTPNRDLAKRQNVKEWLHEVTTRMLDLFLQTNLYNVLPVLYGDMGVFGTGCIAILPDDKDLFRAYSYPIGSYLLALDKRGVVKTFAREYELSVSQVVEEFGLQPNGRDIDWAPISDTVKAAWDAGNYEAPIPISWIVEPNRDAQPNRLEAKYLPYSSCYFETAGPKSKLLRESGFKTFPILAPRWDITGEDTYGTDCPGMTALGDVKQLQLMQRRKAQAINKMVDPALVGPTALKTQKTSLLPGDITYLDVREGQQGLKSIHDVTLNIQHLREDTNETRYLIQRAFYEDLFLMLARGDSTGTGSPITAREVEERHEEKLLALGPVLERTNDELLDPLVDRTYQMMEAAGLIPDAPEELDGVNLKVEYTSIMAQAQKLVGVVGQDRFMVSVGPMIQIFPEVKHKIDSMQVVDDYAEMLGVDPRTVRTTEAAMAMQHQEEAAIAQQRATEQAVAESQTAKNLGTTPMDGDTALARVLAARPEALAAAGATGGGA